MWHAAPGFARNAYGGLEIRAEILLLALLVQLYLHLLMGSWGCQEANAPAPHGKHQPLGSPASARRLQGPCADFKAAVRVGAGQLLPKRPGHQMLPSAGRSAGRLQPAVSPAHAGQLILNVLEVTGLLPRDPLLGQIGGWNEIAVEDGGAPQVRGDCERSMRQPDG
jgi:hypothetical protein